MENIVIVSGDGHAGAPPEIYADYIDPPYRDLIRDKLIPENEMYLKVIPGPGSVDPDVLELIDEDRSIRTGGQNGEWEWSRRLAELDREGVAAEVIQFGVAGAAPCFFAIMNDPYPPDVRAAGAKAFHRFLAEGIQEGGGRFTGVAEPGPCLDITATLKELEWVAAHGFSSVSIPGSTHDPALPPLHDEYFEPFWAACCDLGLRLSVHAGWGQSQGVLAAFVERFLGSVQGDGNTETASMMEAGAASAAEALHTDEDSPLQLDMAPRRVFWQLMLAGVLERHPTLQMVFTEIRADWLPETLRALDALAQEKGTGLRALPSEYWRQHCWITPSSVHTCEIEMRHEIGLDRMMFGVDYPHPESTWPNTVDWIRHTFKGVPESEARKILGENAIDCYGFDRALLEGVAKRIGNPPSALLGDFDIDARLLEIFHGRSGMSRGPEDVDLKAVELLFEDDLACITGLG